MQQFQLYLNMAGSHWRITLPYEVDVGENYAPFLCDPYAPDCTYDFVMGRPEHGQPMLSEPLIRVWRTEDGYEIERLTVLATKPCACIHTVDADPLHVSGWIYPGQEGALQTLNHVLDAGCVEYMLSALGAINLHSSFVRLRGEGILFTAPSGTGKSTQAGLWEQYAGAEQLNGDRTIIRCQNGVWTAYGFPFAGSSGIYRNESAPIRAVAVIRQAPENQIERLKPGEAFRLLYSESAIQRWHETGHTAIVDQLLAFCRDIPVYLLRCTPDERAVRLLQKTLSMEEKHDC